MSDCRVLYVEEAILDGVKRLLSGRVNEILSDSQLVIPLIEWGNYEGETAVVPVIGISTCECSEKERILHLDTYTVGITFYVPEYPDGELHCYAYASAIGWAIGDDSTLGGLPGRVVLTGKKYTPPKLKDCGGRWEIGLTLRITIEGGNDY